MKQLTVEQLNNTNSHTEIKELSLLMDGLERNTLDQLPWEQYQYHPFVEFAVAYNSDAIFLKYYVTELSIRAINTTINSAVWEDSCVEFFISFDDGRHYYNFEFNCIGTTLVGYGPSKEDRKLLPENLISQINYQSVIDNHTGKDIHWELTIRIPKNIFCFNPMTSLKEKKCRVNFYKCGDSLPIPHFIAWSAIRSQEPNFHLPEFFGTLNFSV